MDTQIGSLDVLFKEADKQLQELFNRAEEEKRKVEEAKFLKIKQMKADLENELRSFIPAVVMDYVRFHEDAEKGDFVDNAMSGIYLVFKLPEAMPIYVSAFYNYIDNLWYVHRKYFVHDENGLYIGTHENFLLAVGAAREHYRNHLT